MNREQMDNQAATSWIAGEIKVLHRTIGQPNASAAARSVTTMALVLGVISLEQSKEFVAEIESIVDAHRDQVLAACREKMTTISAPHQNL
ncbi:hypothetical protein [Pseudomonas sp.]|uniref:hypothetical protein n=1 Tax=Pseudomonas sp. TaxID=306 RepID=UPI0028AC386B|nr:hypothetical protein [Pseudomonas sp.]